MACCALLLAVLLWLGAVHAAPHLPAAARLSGFSPPPSSEECQRTCGGVDIPFPFGIGSDHCRLSGKYLIHCNDTGNGVFKPFVGNSLFEIIDISPSNGQMRVFNPISYYCSYNVSTGRVRQTTEWKWNMKKSLFTFSNTANKFTVVGCRAVAYIGDNMDDAKTYMVGCASMCQPRDLTTLTNDICSGIGCCQTAIPLGLQYYKVWFDKRWNTSSVAAVSCSYAVLAEESSFNFSTSYLTSPELQDRKVPVVLDWIIQDQPADNCTIAPTKPGYACVSSNSRCIDAADGLGYICNCTQGFEGNPYLADGCRDIDECHDPAKYPCFGDCDNLNGTFTCSCPAGTRGNAKMEICRKDPLPRRAQIALGISAGVLIVLVAFLATQVLLKRRSNKRQGYFEQHGGQMLSRILKSEGVYFTFFDSGDIVKATCGFHKANIVGEGAHGTVYKGVISVRGTTTTVAVKRCKQIDQSRTDEFVQELVILCRVNHPNIVKLLGCCLHFETPMLVSELVQNGTLSDLLYGKPRRRVTLSTRLRITAEVAEALAYLHSPPHTTLHGDVKPENILLDVGWVAKVSDFGCSTIDDNVQVVPKGTLAYLDPEFLKDFQITYKTDVYSLGVVLMELLTGKKPLAKEQKNLAILFQEAMVNGTLNELLDADLIVEEGAIGVIHRAVELARRCTAIPGKIRPTMVQVAEELRALSNEMPECYQTLLALDVPILGYINESDESECSGFYNVGSVAALSAELAR